MLPLRTTPVIRQSTKATRVRSHPSRTAPERSHRTKRMSRQRRPLMCRPASSPLVHTVSRSSARRQWSGPSQLRLRHSRSLTARRIPDVPVMVRGCRGYPAGLAASSLIWCARRPPCVGGYRDWSASCMTIAICTRLATSSLENRRDTCALTIASLMNSDEASGGARMPRHHRSARAACGDQAHRSHNLLGRGVLHQEPARAGPQRAHHLLVGLERGQHDHLRRCVEPARGRYGNAVHLGPAAPSPSQLRVHQEVA